MKKRPLLAVVTARASASEQMQILEGIITEAFRRNADITVISNIYNASEYNDFITHENSIYSLVRSDVPDGIIITEDSFMNSELRENVFRLIEGSGIPAVSIGSGESRFVSVCNDTSADIEKIADHLTEVHDFTEIDILTGQQDSTEALKRVEGYRRSLIRHGLDFRPENVIYGDFWTGSGEKTALEYISGKRRMPQAVMCANDYMAYSLCDTLIKNGVRVPEDITVTGYEYVGGREEHYPVLTTYCRNRRAMGAAAVSKLCDMLEGITETSGYDLSGHLVSGDSCSCGAEYSCISSETEFRKKQIYYSSLNETGMLEQYLTESGSITDLISALRRHSYFIPDLSGLYLCLFEDWSVSENDHEYDRNTDRKMICYTIADIYRYSDVPLKFSESRIFPEELLADEPNAYYCCPLFFMNEDFGYMIVRYDKVNCFGESFRSWNKIVSNALKFLRMKNDIDYLVDRLNQPEYHDSLTGMNSRNGFLSEAAVSLLSSESRSEYAMIHIRLRTDDFKKYSGSVRYEKTARLTAMVSDILKNYFSGNGYICGRTGQDSFCIADLYSDSQNARMAGEKLNVILYGRFRKEREYGDELVFIHSAEFRVTDTNCEEALTVLEKMADDTAEKFSERTKNRNYDLFSKLRKDIYLNPEKQITADDACRLFLLSSGHFRAVYRELAGRSFHKDCIYLRVMMAKDLLAAGRLNIAAVSEKCGFENEKYFMRQFRLETGFTPNQYRKMIGMIM